MRRFWMVEGTMTDPQLTTLNRKHDPDKEGLTLGAFIDSAQPVFGTDGAIMVSWRGI